MVKLETFSGLTKKQEKLLAKGYSFGSLAFGSFNLSQENLKFKLKGSQTPAPLPFSAIQIFGSSSFEYIYPNLILKAKRNTDGVFNYKVNWTPINYIKDARLKGHCKVENQGTNSKFENKASFIYFHPNAIAKLALSDSPVCIRGSVTAGKPEYGIGFDGNFDLNSQKLHNYNFAFYWFKKHRKIVLKYAGSSREAHELSDFVLSYYQKLNEKTHFGSKITCNLFDKTTAIEFGGDYKMDEKTILRGKINQIGLIGLSLTYKFTPTLALTVSSQTDTRKVTVSSINDYKFGFRIDLNH